MKKRFLLVVVGLMFANAAWATTFEAQCLNQKSKFSNCKVTVNTDALVLEYKNKKEKDLNITIPGSKITAINAGEFSKRNVAAGLLLSPAFFLTKRKKDQISVEYLTENTQAASITFQVKEKYGLPLKSQLQVLSGKVVRDEDEKKVDVQLQL